MLTTTLRSIPHPLPSTQLFLSYSSLNFALQSYSTSCDGQTWNIRWSTSHYQPINPMTKQQSDLRVSTILYVFPGSVWALQRMHCMQHRMAAASSALLPLPLAMATAPPPLVAQTPGNPSFPFKTFFPYGVAETQCFPIPMCLACLRIYKL